MFDWATEVEHASALALTAVCQASQSVDSD